MKAVVLAGGKGTRLAPYTTIFPKPLVPIGERPILEIIIRQLVRQGFNEVLLSIGHLGELIEAYFQNGHRNIPGLKLDYFRELQPLGTAGSLAVIPGLDETFLVMNGDILTNLDYRSFFKYHKANEALCTIASYVKSVKIDLGVIKADENNRLYDYVEKPDLEYTVSMGVYAFRRQALDFIPKDGYFDFPDLIKTLLKEGQKVLRYPFSGHWLDIGRPDDYEKAIEEFDKRKTEFLGGSGK